MPLIITPDSGYVTPMVGPWAIDNGCYTNPKAYSDGRYLTFLSGRDPERCLFATAPDVWGDWLATLERAEPMLDPIRDLGYPAAFVAQDGLEPDYMPWEAGWSAMFIGGSDSWRHSETVPALVAEARAHGLWVHMGRVNSWRRYDYARAIGCDSVDGTVLRFDPQRPVREWVERAVREPHIWDT